MPEDQLWRFIGVTWPDHVAYEVRPGMMGSARNFFIEQLGWHEDEAARVEGDWGEAIFVYPDSDKSFLVQLTCPAESADPRRITENHLALDVVDAEASARAIWCWATLTRLMCCEIEEVSEGKWFVHLPEIFAFSLELISQPWRSS